MTRTTEPFPRSPDGLGRDFSLRNWPKAEPPSRPPLDSAIDSIMRQAEQANREQAQQQNTPQQEQEQRPMADENLDVRQAIAGVAAGRLVDATDALAYLDESKFRAADGSVDRYAIADEITILLQDKPYLAARDDAPQATAAEWQAMTPNQRKQASAEGRLDQLLGPAQHRETPQDAIGRQTAALRRDGITQATAAEVKAMTPEQRVHAQRQGRLLQYLNTPNKER